MPKKLTKSIIESLSPDCDPRSGRKDGQIKPREIIDSGGSGLLVRAQPSGRKYFYVQFRRRAYVKKRKSGQEVLQINTTRLRLGRTDHIDLNTARALARKATNAAKDATCAELIGEDAKQYVKQQLLGLDRTPAELRSDSDHKHSCPKIEDFIRDEYEPYKKLETKYCGDGREINRLIHILQVLGDPNNLNCKFNFLNKKLHQIDSKLVRDWLTRRLGTKSERTKSPPSRVTVLRELNMMRAMFKYAVEREWIDSNPLDGITLKANSKRKIDPLTSEEEDRLLHALKDRESHLRATGKADFDDGEFADFLRPVILVAIHTGMRFGEIASLTWENVEIQSGDQGTRSKIWLADTKNNEAHDIPLNEFITSVLRTWRRQCQIINPQALVFTDKNGERLKDIRRFWRPVFIEAGLPKGYRFHDLRHHFASKLVMSGVPLFAVQSLLNHSSPQMTQRYAKFAPDWMDATVGKLSEEAKWTL